MKIPLYERQVGLTGETAGVMGSLEQAGAPGKSVAQLGEAVAQIAGGVERHRKHAKQLYDLNAATAAADEQNFELQRQVKEHPDPNTWLSQYEEAIKEGHAARLENLSDPEVAASYTKHFNKMLNSGRTAVAAAANKQNASIYFSSVDDNFERDIRHYLMAEDDFDRSRIRGTAFGRLDAGVAALWITPAKAQHLKETWDQKVEMGRANQALMADPAGTLEVLKTPDAFGLDDEKRRVLSAQATAELHRRQRQNDEALYQEYVAQKITPAELKARADAMLAGQQISRTAHSHFEAIFEAEISGVKARTDYDVYWPMRQAAEQGQLDMEAAIRARKAGRLKDADMNSLMRLQQNGAEGKPPDDMPFLKNPAMKQAYNVGLHEIQARLRPLDNSRLEKMGRKMGRATVSPEGSYENQAVVAFIEDCKQAAREGKLTEKWMLQRAVEISMPFEVQGSRGMFRKPGARGAMGRATQGRGLPAPVRAPGPKTITKDGQTYRVVIINGKEMVDPTPLP